MTLVGDPGCSKYTYSDDSVSIFLFRIMTHLRNFVESIPIINIPSIIYFCCRGKMDRAEVIFEKSLLSLIPFFNFYRWYIMICKWSTKRVKMFSPPRVPKIDQNLCGWMNSPLIQSKTFTELYIPGSHDSCAYKFDMNLPLGIFVSWSQCQRASIFQQLSGGVRYLDVRVLDLSVEFDPKRFIPRKDRNAAQLRKEFKPVAEMKYMAQSHMNFMLDVDLGLNLNNHLRYFQEIDAEQSLNVNAVRSLIASKQSDFKIIHQRDHYDGSLLSKPDSSLSTQVVLAQKTSSGLNKGNRTTSKRINMDGADSSAIDLQQVRKRKKVDNNNKTCVSVVHQNNNHNEHQNCNFTTSILTSSHQQQPSIVVPSPTSFCCEPPAVPLPVSHHQCTDVVCCLGPLIPDPVSSGDEAVGRQRVTMTKTSIDLMDDAIISHGKEQKIVLTNSSHSHNNVHHLTRPNDNKNPFFTRTHDDTIITSTTTNNNNRNINHKNILTVAENEEKGREMGPCYEENKSVEIAQSAAELHLTSLPHFSPETRHIEQNKNNTLQVQQPRFSLVESSPQNTDHENNFGDHKTMNHNNTSHNDTHPISKNRSSLLHADPHPSSLPSSSPSNVLAPFHISFPQKGENEEKSEKKEEEKHNDQSSRSSSSLLLALPQHISAANNIQKSSTSDRGKNEEESQAQEKKKNNFDGVSAGKQNENRGPADPSDGGNKFAFSSSPASFSSDSHHELLLEPLNEESGAFEICHSSTSIHLSKPNNNHNDTFPSKPLQTEGEQNDSTLLMSTLLLSCSYRNNNLKNDTKQTAKSLNSTTNNNNNNNIKGTVPCVRPSFLLRRATAS
eukprot:GDKJ01044929.1.p1 GENE.GDKJ01044929.1~~GDKJ01044929.1.p1  ORF type:complete len:835 (-),score=175.40 GDKJ01044929.1:934-3438(-)